MDYAPHGDVSAFASHELGTAAEWTGDPDAFKGALEDAKWLDVDGKIHDWEEYVGRLLTRREADKARKQAARDAARANGPPASAGYPQDVRGSPVLQYPTEPNSTGPDPNAISPPSQARESQAPKGGESRPPTLEVVLAWAEMRGVPKELAEIFFYHYDSIGWVDAGGNRISNPQSRLAKWGAEARAKLHQEKANGSVNGKASEGGFWALTKRMEQLQTEIKAMQDRAGRDASGTLMMDDKERPRYRKLRDELKDVKGKLGLG